MKNGVILSIGYLKEISECRIENYQKKNFEKLKIAYIFAVSIAKVAQLVEHDLAKVGVAGSSPVFRSNVANVTFFCLWVCTRGEIGRRATLRG